MRPLRENKGSSEIETEGVFFDTGEVIHRNFDVMKEFRLSVVGVTFTEVAQIEGFLMKFDEIGVPERAGAEVEFNALDAALPGAVPLILGNINPNLVRDVPVLVVEIDDSLVITSANVRD